MLNSQSTGFALEFHLSYYALRSHTCKVQDSRELRRSGPLFPDSNPNEFLHEAQISFVIIGLDEWVWTAYCLTETYFGSEESIEYYYRRGYDAPSGGAKPMHYPIWNPREYFLFILASRIRQSRQEWFNAVRTLEARIQYHVKLKTPHTHGCRPLTVGRKKVYLVRAAEDLPCLTMPISLVRETILALLISYAFSITPLSSQSSHGRTSKVARYSISRHRSTRCFG